MDVRHLMGMTIEELHSRIGGNIDYLEDVLRGWAPNPGLKTVLKICAECPKIKASYIKPELKGLR